ncbi:zf-HC2 domain-containing protein [candidate division WOR-3 bacterium]|nr:zf-HC2 domain-containing protein [candidate division WOR-3 bacterium]
MKCSKVRRKLSRYLDGEVCPDEQRLLSEHLELCRECQAELAALSRLGDVLNSTLEGMEIQPFFMTRLRQCVREEVRPAMIIEKIRRVAVAAATAVGIVVSLLIGNQAGKTLYRSIASSYVAQGVEESDIFGLSSFDEFSDGSLSDVYNQLVAGGHSG